MRRGGTLRRIGFSDEDALRALLERCPERDVYMRGLVWRVGSGIPEELGTLLGWWVDHQLVGAFLHGSVVVMACEDPDGLAAFAERVGYYWYEQPVVQLMAPRRMSEVFLSHLAGHFGSLPPLLLLRHRMPVMRLARGGLKARGEVGIKDDTAGHALRTAVPEESRAMGDLARAVALEDLGLDPLEFAPESFRVSLEHRIRKGQEFVWLKEGRPVFRAALSGATPDAVIVEGVYVPPDERGKGYGKAGMYVLCERLLNRHEAVVLLVDEGNDAARRLYEGLGFETFDDYQAAFFDVPLSSSPSRLGRGEER